MIKYLTVSEGRIDIMDLTKLRNNQIQLIKFMEKGGYSERYICYIKKELKRLLQYSDSYDNYFDYYNNIIMKSSKNKKELQREKSLLTLIMNYDLYNKFPNRKNFKYKLEEKSNYSKLKYTLKEIIDNYKKEAISRGKSQKTIDTDISCCANFFKYLQDKGFQNLNNIEEINILNYFFDNNENVIYSYSYIKSIKLVLKECNYQINLCNKLIDLLPCQKTNRKNIDYLTKEEIDKIKKVLNDKDNGICLRDKAIVSLLLYTGLRSCDIVNLKLSDIDWNNEIISIVQSKTNVPLELPLTISVGNALFEYITKERPKVDFNNVFVRIDANYPITKSTPEFAVKKVFKEANIRQNDKKRKGTHIFRYNLATSLLKNEIPQPIISQVLGHTSPTSLNFYLSADFYHLKQCALSIQQFENIKEVI